MFWVLRKISSLLFFLVFAINIYTFYANHREDMFTNFKCNTWALIPIKQQHTLSGSIQIWEWLQCRCGFLCHRYGCYKCPNICLKHQKCLLSYKCSLINSHIWLSLLSNIKEMMSRWPINVWFAESMLKCNRGQAGNLFPCLQSLISSFPLPTRHTLLSGH